MKEEMEFTKLSSGGWVRKGIAPANTETATTLRRAGYVFIDRTLEMKIDTRRPPSPLLKTRFTVEEGPPQEIAIRAIARTAFLLDRRFNPKPDYDADLARRLIDEHIDTLLKGAPAALHCLHKDEVCGFALLLREESHVEIALAAVEERYRGSGAALELYHAAAAYAHHAGARSLTGRISAANTAVLNLYAALGARAGASLDVYSGPFAPGT